MKLFGKSLKPGPGLIVLVIAAVITIVGCGDDKKAEEKDAVDQKIEIVTTTGMIADLVKSIGGERVNVTCLIGPGVNPHSYLADEDDQKKITEAEAVFFNGLNLEAAMNETFQKMEKEGKAISISSKIPPPLLITLPGSDNVFDPHIWHDARLMMMAIATVHHKLADIDRAGATLFSDNAREYSTQLQELHTYVSEKLTPIPIDKRIIVSSHNAFNYLGRAYGFENHSLQGIIPDTREEAGNIENLTDMIVERKIPVIFTEYGVYTENTGQLQAAVLARGINLKIGGELYSDCLADANSPAGTYIGMIRHNVELIADALSKR